MYARLLSPCREGRKERRSRHQIQLRRPRQSRTADHRRRIAGIAEALLGRHRQPGPQARRLRDHAGAAAGFGPLPHQGIRAPGVRSGWSESRTIGARDQPTQIGQNNFDELRFEFFRDNLVALEAFKADQADWIAENSAKQWATAYDFPAVTEKRVVKEKFPINNSGRMQAFAFNLRRDQFKDARLRRAFNYAFDFEEMNKQLLYRTVQAHQQLFRRNGACFVGTARGAGAADARDRARQGAGRSIHHALHQSGRRQSGSRARQFAREHEASEGSGLRDTRPQAGRRRGQAGHRRIPGPGSGVPSASRCSTSRRWNGMASRPRIRIVDDAQYQNRLRSFDFDYHRPAGAESLSPGNEQREFWGSQSADQPGSRNTVGIKNPAVDALIEQVIFAKDRAGLVAATKALDRVLLWNFYVVPQFTYPIFSVTRAGTASATPSRCRNLAVPACRPCGGSTPTRPPRSANAVEGYPRAWRSLSRRHVLGLGIGALSAPLLRPREGGRLSTPRFTGCRCSAT